MWNYNGPRYSDGPFCAVRVYREPDGVLQTYTFRELRGGALVERPGGLVNSLGVGMVPTWKLLK